MLITQAPKGTRDILPQESYLWHHVEQVMRDTCALFGFREVRTPCFEHTELFLRSVGDTTDIVQKEMYTFLDKGGRSVTLKPEGTAGVARGFVEHSLYGNPLPLKMYYLYSPSFRYEKPQAGRLREFHQFGVEAFGAADPSMDAEVIHLALSVLGTLGMGKMVVNINSIGCPQCRPLYQQRLLSYFREYEGRLCETCRQRMERNPLRVLDCKDPGCRPIVEGAPNTVDCLCEDCQDHFERLKKYLTALGVDYAVDPRIVRGLDYYTRTVFEIIATEIGAQSTVCGGGRYDGLIEEIGGPATPAMGFGMGMERLLMLMEKRGIAVAEPAVTQVFLATMGEDARIAAVSQAAELRRAGIRADLDHAARSVRAQLKYADKLGCPWVVVLGQDELTSGVVNVRTMASSSQVPVKLNELTAYFIARQREEEK